MKLTQPQSRLALSPEFVARVNDYLALVRDTDDPALGHVIWLKGYFAARRSKQEGGA